MMIGLDLGPEDMTEQARDELCARLVRSCLEHGLLVNSSRNGSLMLSFALTTSKQEIDEALRRLQTAIGAVG
jgi:4-aminobutyrate aminotransferase-like enzyme